MMDQDVMLLDQGPAWLPWHPTDLYVFKYFTNVTLKSPAQTTNPPPKCVNLDITS